MRSALLELPDECICVIFSFLAPSQAQRVVLTFNRRLLLIAEPFLKPLKKIKEDEAYFEPLFGEIKLNESDEISEEFLQDLEFTELPISIPSRPSHHLGYLDLNDDLSWLEAIAQVDDYDFEAENGAVVNLDKDGEGLEELIGTTTRLGLTLPPSFVKILRSEKLLKIFPTSFAGHIKLSSLYKTRKQLKDDPTRQEEGYIFTWFSDQYGGDYTSMYLDMAGRHAVLSGDFGPARTKEEKESIVEDWLDLTPAEKREGILQIDSGCVSKYFLEDVDFERWLVNRYFRQRSFFLDWSKDDEDGKASVELPDFMKEYFRNVYTKRGRRMQWMD